MNGGGGGGGGLFLSLFFQTSEVAGWTVPVSVADPETSERGGQET